MKRISFIFLATFLAIPFFTKAQNTPYDFLTVVIEKPTGELDQVIYYPEGSTHQVQAENGQQLSPLSSTPGAFVYEGEMELLIFPEYRKKQPDHYPLYDQKLKIFTTAKAAYAAGFGDDWNSDATEHRPPTAIIAVPKKQDVPHDVTARKELSASKVNPGRYNLQLTFSNGIVFTYEDGGLQATLQGKSLDIVGKYLIESELGTAKVSFDPDDGETWWVFEKNQTK